MERLKFSKPLSMAIVIALASPLLMADDQAGWYLGGSIGSSRADIDTDGISRGLMTNGLTTDSIKTDDDNFGYKLLGGYQFNKNLALEGGYFDLGSFGYKATTTPTGTLAGDIKVKGLNLDLVGTLNFTQRFSALARAGIIGTRTKDSFTGTGAVTPRNFNPSKNDTNYKFGVGLQYAVAPALNLRAEVERYRINDAIKNKGDVDLFSVGFIYKFGVKKKQITPAPVFVPEKLVVLVFEDVHFTFDSSSLTKEAQTNIDESVSILKKNPTSKIRIAGYTSASGTEKYNQNLSEERAQAVKDYLVKKGVKQQQLSIIGYGQHRSAQYEAIPRNINSPAARANMRVLFEVIIE